MALPEPPYWAVIFPNQRNGEDDAGYAAMSEQMVHLAKQQRGFLGIQSVRGADGFGITVSYWDDEESILRWKHHTDHLMAQRQGMERWYERYEIRVARVERGYSGPEGRHFG